LYVGYSGGTGELPKDGQEALKWLRLAAENGDVGAQYHLGVSYCCGDEYEWMGIKEDFTEAARWLRLAANRGDLNALESLESLYQPGEMLPEDPTRAFQWLLDVAEDGDCVAQNLVAERYMQGEGVAKNISEAAKWYEASAEQGHPWAQLKLGHLYAEGKGVNQSLDSARYWYVIAMEQKKSDGVYGGVQCNVQEEAALALMQLVKPDLQPKPATVIVSPGESMDMQWKLPTGWENALSWSNIDLPDNGHIIKLRVGAEGGVSDCQNLLGVLFLTGTGVPFNMIAGQALFELAAAAGDKDAADNLIMSLNGGGKAAGVEKLARQMSKPGKFLEALDKFVAYRESKRKPRKPKA
jgi:TPR repeat protein